MSACYDLYIDIELDWESCLGGMTTLNMRNQLDKVLNSEITIVFFWHGGNEIEKLLEIKDRFGDHEFWYARNNLKKRIFDILNQLVRAGKLVYVLGLPIRLFFFINIIIIHNSQRKSLMKIRQGHTKAVHGMLLID